MVHWDFRPSCKSDRNQIKHLIKKWTSIKHISISTYEIWYLKESWVISLTDQRYQFLTDLGKQITWQFIRIYSRMISVTYHQYRVPTHRIQVKLGHSIASLSYPPLHPELLKMNFLFGLGLEWRRNRKNSLALARNTGLNHLLKIFNDISVLRT